MSLKRILAGILSASLVLTVALSGCNNGQSGSADPSSSTGEGSSAASAAESEDTGDKPEKLQAIVDNDTVGIIQPAADILERDEGIKTEFIVQSYDQSYTKIMTSIMGGTPIDVIICDSVWTAEFTEAGMITPVDDYISAELKEDLSRALWINAAMRAS
ncbi:Bacterial extracellular solute-binding, family 1 [human gut metagenome]|uniref:Bacterial extracellular solute-binding, family 1 n=1 Tax=human gut metagenome TaxID=408170 RepID=K1U4C1_9ZZZZ